MSDPVNDLKRELLAAAERQHGHVAGPVSRRRLGELPGRSRLVLAAATLAVAAAVALIVTAPWDSSPSFLAKAEAALAQHADTVLHMKMETTSTWTRRACKVTGTQVEVWIDETPPHSYRILLNDLPPDPVHTDPHTPGCSSGKASDFGGTYDDTILSSDYSGNIVVAGTGVTLNCEGHRVLGSGEITGINAVANGVTVTHCQVRGFEVGIQTTASATRLIANFVADNDHGIRVAGAVSATVFANRAIHNRSAGIVVSQGAIFTTVNRNAANENDLIGIGLNGVTNTVVSENTASRNAETGISSLASAHNQILRNVANFNGNLGIDFLDADQNSVTSNVAANNGTPGNGTGFNFNHSSGNIVSKNAAPNNGGVGFFVFLASQGNVFTLNVACGNFFVDALALDTSVGNPNTWTNNAFCTSKDI